MEAKPIIGILLIVLGIILGLYIGVWICFIGGIVGIITEIRADEFKIMAAVWSIAKIIFAGFIGNLSAMFLILPGYILVNGAE